MESLFIRTCDHIKGRNVYLDKKSKEKRTNIIKRKYKLAGTVVIELKQFLFFIITTQKESYSKKTSIVVHGSEWINKDKRYCKKFDSDSILDVTRYEILSPKEVSVKIKDGSNGFNRIAELPPEKMRIFQEKLKERRSKHKIPMEMRKIIGKSLGMSERIMKELGI